LIALASEVAKANHSVIVTAEALDTCLGKRAVATAPESEEALNGEQGLRKQKKSTTTSSSSSSSSSSSTKLSKEEQLLADVHKHVDQQMNSFDPATDSDLKKLKSSLMKEKSSSNADSMDDDIELVESGMQEVDTKCPFSQQTFKNPMKRFLISTYIHAMHAYIHTYIHSYIYTCHACIHTYIHTYIHTCMQT